MVATGTNMDFLLVAETTKKTRLTHLDGVVIAAGKEQVRELCQRHAFRLIVVDLAAEGLDFCQELRRAEITTPLLLLLPNLDVQTWVQGLDAGADHVLDAESDPKVVEAQIRAGLRRSGLGRNRIQIGELALDIIHHRAERRGVLIPLSATEYQLLLLFMENAGRVVSREEIMSKAWPNGTAERDNVLDVYVSYLRGKIDRPFDTPLLKTVRGQGYRICPPSN
jgi:two-component system, OmpR family, response regulator